MRTDVFPMLARGRIKTGPFASDPKWGLHGAFIIAGPCAQELKIIASEGTDQEAQEWEHVSVSCRNRCPNWPEMCFVKNLFWAGDETVIQFHPAESEYINQHPFCLHMWKPVSTEIQLPPGILVGLTLGMNHAGPPELLLPRAAEDAATRKDAGPAAPPASSDEVR